MSATDDKPTMTVAEVAAELRCDEDTVVEWIKAGTIPALKPGRSWVIPRAAYLTALNALALGLAEQRRRVADEPRASGPRRTEPLQLPELGAILNLQGATR